MIDGRPSATAEYVAKRRAVHQLVDDPRVHDDPLALAILGDAQAAALRASLRRFQGRLVRPAFRAFLAVRSRVAEDALARAVAAGVGHYVVLGAGLDTFAYRNPYPGLRVLEVDHPATQAWKRQRLNDARITVPEGVTFAAVDFATESLSAALHKAGLRREEPSYFSWLGVTYYLKPADVLATLKEIAPFAASGGGVTLDYLVPPASLAPATQVALAAPAARVAAKGEPFRGFLGTEALLAALRGMGLHEVRNWTPEELNATYFSNRADGLRVGGATRVIPALG